MYDIENFFTEGGKNLREHILEVATKLFIKNGYNATTTGDIVRYSGSSKGNLYYHFKTKENLFLEILKIEEEKWFARWLNEEKKCQSNREKFFLFNELSVKIDAYYYSLQTAIIEFYDGDESKDIGEKINELEQRYIDTYNIIFSAGNKESEWNIVDVESASEIAAATIYGIITFTNKVDIKKRMKLMNRFSQIFLKGVE